MKLFIDDERPAPSRWILAQDSTTAIELLDLVADAGYQLEAVSLDFDLDGEDIIPVVEAMRDFDLWPREVYIHTANEDGEDLLRKTIGALKPGLIRGYGCNYWGTGPDSVIRNEVNP